MKYLYYAYVTCRCEQCEYESKVYVDGQKFPSRDGPCLQCYCSVSVLVMQCFIDGAGFGVSKPFISKI